MTTRHLQIDDEEVEILMRLVEKSKDNQPLSDSERNKRVGLYQKLETLYFKS
jgi:hypothetical protein